MNTTQKHSRFLVVVFFLAEVWGTSGQDALANMPPVADAGLARYAAKDPVQLDGSRSYDPDNSGSLNYTWTQVSGPPLVVTGANTATPTICGSTSTTERGATVTGSFVQTDAIQECEFALVVSDGELTSSPDTVKVLIVPTFPNCTMTLENTSFDPGKPTVLYFHGGTSEQTGGGRLNRPLWSEKANVISFPSYVGDAGTFSGAQANKSYMRPGDMIIVYLSSVAPDYSQPIQTLGWSIGGLLALDVARHLNLTYADPRYAVNHACLLDPSAWVMGTTEFHRRIALLLANPVAGEQCWVASLEAANASVSPSALNIVFSVDHALPYNWYLNSLADVEDAPFNHGVVAGAYWSILGPGRNLQLASTPEVQAYKFRWIGSATTGQMELFHELNHPGRLPEPVILGAWAGLSDTSGDLEGVVLSCHLSENAVRYELLLGPDPYRVMDFRVVSDTPLPPMDVVREFRPGETWWTIRARDQYGSTVHADPVLLDATTFDPPTVQNARTGKRYGLIAHAMLEVKPGDTILLGPAIYQEEIVATIPMTVSSLHPDDPLVVAGTIVRGRTREPTVTFIGSESMGSTLAGLTIQGRTTGISCRDAMPTIRNCVVECPDATAVEFWHGCGPQLIECRLVGQVREGGDPGLIAYWKLDETEGVLARDSEGKNDATVLGLGLWQPQGGRVGGGLELNGSTFAATTNPARNPADGPFSVLAWIKGGAPGQVFVSQQAGANWLMADPAQGTLRTELVPPSNRKAVPPLVSESVITDGNWHRVAFTWDGAKRRLYVDGVLAAEDTQDNLAPSYGKLVLGAGKTMAPGTFWTGRIDDVRIYDRVVRP